MVSSSPRSFSVVQVSDTHITHLGGVTSQNLARLVEITNDELKPDLVVHTGDLLAADPDVDVDRTVAAASLAGFHAPLRVLPGNHDVGEPGDAWLGLRVTSERIAAHRATFGPDRFVCELGPWTVIGCNSELFGSGLDEEEDQWAWLAHVLGRDHHRPTVLFLHKPVFPPPPHVGEGQRSIPAGARERLLSLPGAVMVRAIGSGHLHRFRRRVRADLLEIWAPASGFRGRTPSEHTHFEQLGLVEWRLGTDRVDAFFRAPADLVELGAREIPEVASEIARLERAPSSAESAAC